MKLVSPKVEIITPIDGEKILKHIEICARNCYKSEDKITPDSARSMIKKLIALGHEAMIEHYNITVKLTCDVGCYKDLTRHRHASFAIECLSGDTRVLKNMTIKELYERSQNQYGKTLHLRSVNENGEIIPNKIKDVWYKGVAPVYQLKTNLGYTIKATENHFFKTKDGYKPLKELAVGDEVYVKGKPYETYRGWEVGKKEHLDKIVAVEYIGEEDVYDIEMQSPYNNFVANGFIVHNSTRFCNYSKGKYGSELTFIKPCNLEKGTKEYNLWKECMVAIETYYNLMAGLGCKPDQLRMLLPHSTKADVMMTANLREWRHIFKLRCSPAAHPSVQEVMKMLLKEFKEKIPVVFDDIKGL